MRLKKLIFVFFFILNSSYDLAFGSSDTIVVNKILNKVSGCWSVPIGLPATENLIVKIRLILRSDGSVAKSEIIDLQRMNKPGQGFYEVLAESALRAVRLCSPFNIQVANNQEIILKLDAKKKLIGTPSIEEDKTNITENNTEVTKQKVTKDENTKLEEVLSLASADECIEGDCENGTGTYLYSTGVKSGSKFTGEWKNGKRDGKGIIVTKDGSIFEGEFKNDKAIGKGTWSSPNGNKYKGEIKEDRFIFETIIFPNGDKYTGDFKNNLIEGKGTLTLSNGNKYTGEFKNDLMDGKGTYIFTNGEKIVGDFKDDQIIKGTYSWVDGSKYIGEFKNGLKDGIGTYVFTDGGRYEGQWIEDRKNGKGEYYVGIDTNERNKGILKYEGSWKNDKRHGKFTKVFLNGVREEIEYVNGKLISNVKSNSNGVMSVTDVILDYDSLVGKWIVVKGHYLNLDGTSGYLSAGLASFNSLEIYTKNAERSIRKYLLENCDFFGCNLEISGYVKKTKKTKRKYIDLRKIKKKASSPF